MNLVYESSPTPLRLLIVNGTKEAAILLAAKALRGMCFGQKQLIDLTLLVYSNEVSKAEYIKWSLDGGAFPCNNSITITCDLPKITDADVFIFLTEFPNLNSMDFDAIDDEENFDSLYLLLKIADNLEMPPPAEEPPAPKKPIILKNIKPPPPKPFKPVIVVDGLVTLDILNSFTKDLPTDYFFCPSPIAAVAKSILGEYLKVQCSDINRMYVWGANDENIHVDVAVPLFIPEKNSERRHCEWNVMADRELEDLNMDFTQFNASWLKKDLVYKTLAVLANHQHGPIFKAAKISDAIRDIWESRSNKSETYKNMGVISDGSLDTIKGLPYYLPIKFNEDSFVIDTYNQHDIQLKHEIKRMNKALQTHHKKLISTCKKFFQRNVLNQQINMPPESSIFSIASSSSTAD